LGTERRRQSFLNAVVHIPNFFATVCSGRWKLSFSIFGVIDSRLHAASLTKRGLASVATPDCRDVSLIGPNPQWVSGALAVSGTLDDGAACGSESFRISAVSSSLTGSFP
jgi:hypothetical protein